MNAGDEVQHPQWGRGTVLFDKAECIGIRFLEHGQVNFTQEEWASQHSPSSRFSSTSDLEYALQSAVEDGDLSEEQAQRLLERRVHPMEIRRKGQPGINEAYALLVAHPTDLNIEDDFYKTLLKHIYMLVKARAHDESTYSNIEDAVQESALEIWQRLPQFEASRNSFKNWVELIALHNIRDLLRKHRTSRGNPNQTRPDELTNRWVALDENVASTALSADKKVLFEEFLKGLQPTDRSILQMSIDGLTTREIAAALNLSAMTVSRRLKELRAVTKSPF